MHMAVMCFRMSVRIMGCPESVCWLFGTLSGRLFDLFLLLPESILLGIVVFFDNMVFSDIMVNNMGMDRTGDQTHPIVIRACSFTSNV